VTPDPRAEAARCLVDIIHNGKTFDQPGWPGMGEADQRLCRLLILETLRHGLSLESQARGALKKPLRKKDQDILMLVMLGLCQLQHLDMPPHAALNETVSATTALGKGWAKGLVNAILRKQLRGPLPVAPECLSEHPAALYRMLQDSWPGALTGIILANNRRAPVYLRARCGLEPLATWLDECREAGIMLTPVPGHPRAFQVPKGVNITHIPGFEAGRFVVQDLSAQLAAPLLSPRAGEHILDACSAPGGKATHLLDLCQDIQLTCLDHSDRRIHRMHDNMARLGQHPRILQGDASTRDWWDGTRFDAILCDVPCSGTGIIRRHPDIRFQRTVGKIQSLTALQQQIIDNLWQTLRPGGRMLYTTCAILREENGLQMEAFLRRHPDALARPVSLPEGLKAGPGVQRLQTTEGGDGFYYCLLEKQG
jgi:16S rRNA (cytosine967-C5)-methyltransferase